MCADTATSRGWLAPTDSRCALTLQRAAGGWLVRALQPACRRSWLMARAPCSARPHDPRGPGPCAAHVRQRAGHVTRTRPHTRVSRTWWPAGRGRLQLLCAHAGRGRLAVCTCGPRAACSVHMRAACGLLSCGFASPLRERLAVPRCKAHAAARAGGRRHMGQAPRAAHKSRC